MQFLRSNSDFPFSSAVIHGGNVLEAVLTAIDPGESKPIEGGPAAEMQHIFDQLDDVNALVLVVDKTIALGSERTGGVARVHVVGFTEYEPGKFNPR